MAGDCVIAFALLNISALARVVNSAVLWSAGGTVREFFRADDAVVVELRPNGEEYAAAVCGTYRAFGVGAYDFPSAASAAV